MLEKQLVLTPSLRKETCEMDEEERSKGSTGAPSLARSVMRAIGHHSISLFRINMKKQEEKIIEK